MQVFFMGKSILLKNYQMKNSTVPNGFDREKRNIANFNGREEVN